MRKTEAMRTEEERIAKAMMEAALIPGAEGLYYNGSEWLDANEVAVDRAKVAEDTDNDATN